MVTRTASKPDISFFCPAYYDEKNIRNVIERVQRTLEQIANNYEIVIIDDGSPDGTGAVAEQLAREFSHVSVYHHERNLGYGASLKRGFELARMYEYVCFTDGDNQYDFGEIVNMLPLLADYDAVISYRKVKKYSLFRKFMSRVYNIMVQVLFRVPFRDANASLKIFKRSVIDAIDIRSRSPFVDAEIIVKARNKGFNIKEIGIFSYPRIHGRSSSVRPRNVLATVYDMVRLWWEERSACSRHTGKTGD